MLQIKLRFLGRVRLRDLENLVSVNEKVKTLQNRMKHYILMFCQQITIFVQRSSLPHLNVFCFDAWPCPRHY